MSHGVWLPGTPLRAFCLWRLNGVKKWWQEMRLHLPPLAQLCEMPMELRESHAGCIGARRLICLDLEAAFNRGLVTACLSDQNLKLERIAQSDKSSWHLDLRD